MALNTNPGASITLKSARYYDSAGKLLREFIEQPRTLAPLASTEVFVEHRQHHLRFWVADMHVDSLRFDLASVMGRDYQGRVLVEPPVVEMIAEEGVLADTKLIAEPWDAAGLYQVGTFPFGRRWSEWNGLYRDDVRRFWRGEPGMAGAKAPPLSPITR